MSFGITLIGTNRQLTDAPAPCEPPLLLGIEDMLQGNLYGLINGVGAEKLVAALGFDSINLPCVIIAAPPFRRELVVAVLLEVFKDGKVVRKFRTPQDERKEQSSGEADKDRQQSRGPQ